MVRLNIFDVDAVDSPGFLQDFYRNTKSINSWDVATVTQQNQNSSFCRILHVELMQGRILLKHKMFLKFLRKSLLLLSHWLWFQSYITGSTQYVT